MCGTSFQKNYDSGNQTSVLRKQFILPSWNQPLPPQGWPSTTMLQYYRYMPTVTMMMIINILFVYSLMIAESSLIIIITIPPHPIKSLFFGWMKNRKVFLTLHYVTSRVIIMVWPGSSVSSHHIARRNRCWCFYHNMALSLSVRLLSLCSAKLDLHKPKKRGKKYETEIYGKCNAEFFLI